MSARLDIYWSFRSPYSYLVNGRLADLLAAFDVEANFRPVRPLALREDGFFKKARPQFVPYLIRDVLREAEMRNIPFAMPQPDPIVMDLATGEVPAEQPYFKRLIGPGVAACKIGKGFEFACAVAPKVWGGAQNWHEGDVLATACAEAGLDLAALDQWAADNPGEIDETIAENETAQLKHHWGVPLVVINDEEPFFGQDRIDTLSWRLDQMGLRRD